MHVHHHHHGSTIDYVGLALAVIASWVGIPGPGEPVLIATGILAAKHNLDISSVLVVAWVAAMLGGIAGWIIGRVAGRGILIAPGPFRRQRLTAIERSERIFNRHPVIAVIVTTSWIAGIHNVRTAVFLPAITLNAVLWVLVIGLGSYLVGPSVVDVTNDLGLVTASAIAALVVLAVGGGLIRRHRRASHAAKG